VRPAGSRRADAVRITRIVAEVTELDVDEIWQQRDKHFMDDLGIDSMLALEIVASIEKKYRIEIPEEALLDVTSLNATIDLVQRLLSESAAA
jgi:acyl carrier protein